MGQAVRDDRYRLVRWLDRSGTVQSYELYDHRSDPDETVNVAHDEENGAVLFELTAEPDRVFLPPFSRDPE